MAAALAATWLLVGAAPVRAHEAPASVTARPGNPTIISGSADSGFAARLTRIDVTVIPTADQLATPTSWVHCDSDCGQHEDFSWPVALSYNGPYRVVANVEHCADVILVCDVHTTTVSSDFTVAVPPDPPAGLTARVQDRNVILTWSAANHPDLVGYAILRRGPGGGDVRPLELVTSGTSYLDEQTALAGGRFEYQIASVREGAVPGEPAGWLTAAGDLVPVDVPPPPPSGDGATGGTGSSPAPGPSAATSGDLASFLSSAAANVNVPSSGGPTSVELPDTGFSQNLPFPEGPKVEGRQLGRPSTAAGTGRVEEGDEGLSAANRRALLVPVAAGSVLCVAALHLRWLSRRLVAAGAGSLAGADLEPAEIELLSDPDAFAPDREPVGAGVAGGARSGGGPGAG